MRAMKHSTSAYFRTFGGSMAEPIIWLHEDALRITHPVFTAAPQGTRVIHIWDDSYLRNASYSLKRLVFIYETLSALPLEILRGDTLEVLRECNASMLYVPATINPAFKTIIDAVSREIQVRLVADEPFVTLAKPKDYTRFFQYWGKAEKSAFLKNGGADA
jgi:hypothetical protein